MPENKITILFIYFYLATLNNIQVIKQIIYIYKHSLRTVLIPDKNSNLTLSIQLNYLRRRNVFISHIRPWHLLHVCNGIGFGMGFLPGDWSSMFHPDSPPQEESSAAKLLKVALSNPLTFPPEVPSGKLERGRNMTMV